MSKAYWFVTRPLDAEHCHSFLIYNCTGQLHYELTRFGKLAAVTLSNETSRIYLYALLPYFTWLDTDEWQVKSRRHWQSPPEQVRWIVEDYLFQQMNCQIQQHQHSFKIIRPTAKTPSKVRRLLTALKCFYNFMIRHGYYAYPNTLNEEANA